MGGNSSKTSIISYEEAVKRRNYTNSHIVVVGRIKILREIHRNFPEFSMHWSIFPFVLSSASFFFYPKSDKIRDVFLLLTTLVVQFTHTSTQILSFEKLTIKRKTSVVCRTCTPHRQSFWKICDNYSRGSSGKKFAYQICCFPRLVLWIDKKKWMNRFN